MTCLTNVTRSRGLMTSGASRPRVSFSPIVRLCSSCASHWRSSSLSAQDHPRPRPRERCRSTSCEASSSRASRDRARESPPPSGGCWRDRVAQRPRRDSARTSLRAPSSIRWSSPAALPPSISARASLQVPTPGTGWRGWRSSCGRCRPPARRRFSCSSTAQRYPASSPAFTRSSRSRSRSCGRRTSRCLRHVGRRKDLPTSG